jgi:hypothetical protein
MGYVLRRKYSVKTKKVFFLTREHVTETWDEILYSPISERLVD